LAHHAENNVWGYHFVRADATCFLNFLFQQNGTLVVSTNPNPAVPGAIVGTLPVGKFHTGTFQNWEFVYVPNTAVFPAPANGQAYIYLEGELALLVNGLTVQDVCTKQSIGAPFVIGSTPNTCIKSWVIWDSAGAQNNAPMGPRRIGTRVATGVGANNMWTVNGAADAAAATNNIPYNLAKYIEGDNNGDITDLTLPLGNVTITAIAGFASKP
jgi:hypothetical protein